MSQTSCLTVVAMSHEFYELTKRVAGLLGIKRIETDEMKIEGVTVLCTYSSWNELIQKKNELLATLRGFTDTSKTKFLIVERRDIVPGEFRVTIIYPVDINVSE